MGLVTPTAVIADQPTVKTKYACWNGLSILLHW